MSLICMPVTVLTILVDTPEPLKKGVSDIKFEKRFLPGSVCTSLIWSGIIYHANKGSSEKMTVKM